MTQQNTNLGRMVLNGLLELRTSKGRITLEDVGVMFLDMSAEYYQKLSEHDRFMHEEISRLAAYIDETNREIFAIAKNEKSEDAILDASLHLDEVVKATEQATNTIMDAADIIQAEAGALEGDKGQKIMDATNTIYDACNFQDITGQRVNKVIKLLTNIETRISKLNTLLSTVASEEAQNPNNVLPMSTPSDKDLLNGPALPSQATTQDDIDQLFASLGGGN